MTNLQFDTLSQPGAYSESSAEPAPGPSHGKAVLSVTAVKGDSLVSPSDGDGDDPRLRPSAHLILRSTITSLAPGRHLKVNVMLDTGGTRYAFADDRFVRQHKLPLIALRKPLVYELADGEKRGMITYSTLVEVDTQSLFCCLLSILIPMPTTVQL